MADKKQKRKARPLRSGTTVDITNSMRSSLCLWAALTCPDNETWLELMEDVLHTQVCDCGYGRESRIWDVIIGHMASTIAEA